MLQVDPLGLAYRAATASIMEAVKSNAENRWRTAMVEGLKQEMLDLFLEATVPEVAALKRIYSYLTASFLSQRTQDPRAASVETQKVARDEGIRQQFIDAFVEARTLQKEGATFERIMYQTSQRIHSSIETAGQRAKISQARDSLIAAKVEKYKRVVRPDESESGSCPLCLLASTRVYYVSTLLPIHIRCNCDVDVIQDGDITVVDGTEYVGLRTLVIPEELMTMGPRSNPKSVRSKMKGYLQDIDKKQFSAGLQAWEKTVLIEDTKIGPTLLYQSPNKGPDPRTVLGLPDDRGRWVYTPVGTPVDRGNWISHEWSIDPATYPEKITTVTNGRESTIYYDPNLTGVEAGRERGSIAPTRGGNAQSTGAEVTFTTKENRVSDLLPPSGSYTEPGAFLYRGMSSEEYHTALQNGYFQSTGAFNVGGEAQAGKTYFSTKPDQAGNYASWYAPPEFKPTFDHPAYVIAIPDNPALPREQSWEVGVPGRIPVDQVKQVYVGQVFVVQPGRVSGNESYGDAFKKWESAGSSQVNSRVVWSVASPAALSQSPLSTGTATRSAVTKSARPGALSRRQSLDTALDRFKKRWPKVDISSIESDAIRARRSFAALGRGETLKERENIVRDFLIGTDKVLTRFPKVAREPVKYTIEFPAGGRAYAETTYLTKVFPGTDKPPEQHGKAQSVILNKSWVDDPAGYKQSYEDMIKTRYFYPDDGRPGESTGIHETVHVVDIFSGVTLDHAVVYEVLADAYYEIEGTSVDVAGEWSPEFPAFDDWVQRNLPGYSLENGMVFPPEAVANAAADVIQRGEKANVTSKALYNYLIDKSVSGKVLTSGQAAKLYMEIK